MSRQAAQFVVMLKDAIYFIQKGEIDKAVKILDVMIKKLTPKIQDNDPAQ